jgi:SAM-dependent methyltransferase
MIGSLRRTGGRTLRRLGWRRGGVALDASWYDRAYARGGNYAEPYASSIHYPVWTVIVDRVRRLGRPPMLDIGCGPGQFADMLADHEIDRYVGFDFSGAAIEIANRRARPGHAFRVADATDPERIAMWRRRSWCAWRCWSTLIETISCSDTRRPAPSSSAPSRVSTIGTSEQSRNRAGPMIE